MADTEFLSRAEWERAVENRLGTSAFDVLSWKVNRMLTTGGFLGDHFLAQVTVRLHEPETKDDVLHFFLKTEPIMKPDQREITKQIYAFQKEVDSLDILFPKVRSALNENGKNMPWTCRCYYTRPDIIVLEDLSLQGFRNFNLREVMSFKHFALAIEALANLHAASIIYEEQQRQPYRLDAVYPDLFRESLFRHAPNHPGTAWLDASVKAAWCLVELIRGKDALLRMKVKIEEAMYALYELQKPSERFRNVICQGDVKRDNILYLHEGIEPVDVIIVDYQFVRYTPPANDIMCFLYLSHNRQFRQEYGGQLLSIYYQRLSENLQQHGLDSDKILPWEELKESCDFYKILGLLVTSCYSPGTYMKGEDIGPVFESSEEFARFLKVDRSPEVIHCFKTDDYYRKNVTEVIEEFIEECVEKDFPTK